MRWLVYYRPTMKPKTRALLLTAGLITYGWLTGQAYIIYNKTDIPLHVNDKFAPFGYAGIIPAHGSDSCSSHNVGCMGPIHFYVDDPRDPNHPTLCQWKGRADDSEKQYFTIEVKDPSKQGSSGWCEMRMHYF